MPIEASKERREIPAASQPTVQTSGQDLVDFPNLLAHIEREKAAVREEVAKRIETYVLPLVAALRRMTSAVDLKHLALLERCLKELAFSCCSSFQQAAPDLTRMEIQICHMIRAGMTNKDIAALVLISALTVHTHRNNIRKKLGLTGSKINLTSHLQLGCPRRRRAARARQPSPH